MSAPKHGNYRWVHFQEAIEEARERDEILVGFDEVLWRGSGAAVQVVHIVAEPQFWEHDEPKGYLVELVRPYWMYGAEGQLFPLRWVGRLKAPTMEEISNVGADNRMWDELPERASYLWAMKKQDWERCGIPWWRVFRESSEAGQCPGCGKPRRWHAAGQYVHSDTGYSRCEARECPDDDPRRGHG